MRDEGEGVSAALRYGGTALCRGVVDMRVAIVVSYALIKGAKHDVHA